MEENRVLIAIHCFVKVNLSEKFSFKMVRQYQQDFVPCFGNNA